MLVFSYFIKKILAYSERIQKKKTLKSKGKNFRFLVFCGNMDKKPSW
jgi:hypothetical protein